MLEILIGYLSRSLVSKETLALHQWRMIDDLTIVCTNSFISYYC